MVWTHSLCHILRPHKQLWLWFQFLFFSPLFDQWPARSFSLLLAPLSVFLLFFFFFFNEVEAVLYLGEWKTRWDRPAELSISNEASPFSSERDDVQKSKLPAIQLYRVLQLFCPRVRFLSNFRTDLRLVMELQKLVEEERQTWSDHTVPR